MIYQGAPPMSDFAYCWITSVTCFVERADCGRMKYWESSMIDLLTKMTKSGYLS